jgi:heterodisulfide reductase subunit C
MEDLLNETFDWDFVDKVQVLAGQNINLCYQCKKCTSGCPIVHQMDYSPSQIIHATRLGLKNLVLKSNTIWLCASCQTCTTRCPQDIDIAKVMDAGRIIARIERYKPAVSEIPIFNKTFLQNIRVFGRVYEAGLMLLLKLRTGEIKKDLNLGIKMIKRGKLKLLPSFSQIIEINKMFSRVKKLEHKRI